MSDPARHWHAGLPRRAGCALHARLCTSCQCGPPSYRRTRSHAQSRGLGWGSTFHGHIRIEAVPEEDDHAASSARKPSRMPSTERPPSTPKGLRGLRVLLAEPCLVVRQVRRRRF